MPLKIKGCNDRCFDQSRRSRQFRRGRFNSNNNNRRDQNDRRFNGDENTKEEIGPMRYEPVMTEGNGTEKELKKSSLNKILTTKVKKEILILRDSAQNPPY